MSKIKVFTVDAFTNQPFQGNPAGVVLLNTWLPLELMQNLARELNLSETAFVLLKEESKDFIEVKYFTPSQEINFCGHATLSVAWILFTKGIVSPSEPLNLKTKAGIIPLDFRFENGALQEVFMNQISPKVKDLKIDKVKICHILGLHQTDIDDNFPIKLAYTGIWHLIIPVRTRQAIDKASPNYQELKSYNQEINVSTTHLFTINSDSFAHLLYTRDFAPSSGVNEDPVTGSANGALAGYLATLGFEKQEYKVLQGNSQNRLGEVFIRVKKENDQYRIQVGGSAVTMFEIEYKI